VPGALDNDPDTTKEFEARKAFRAAFARYSALERALCEALRVDRLPANAIILTVDLAGVALLDAFDEEILKPSYSPATGFSAELEPGSAAAFDHIRAFASQDLIDIPSDYAEAADRGKR